MSEAIVSALREKIRLKRMELETKRSEIFLLEKELRETVENSETYKAYQKALS